MFIRRDINTNIREKTNKLIHLSWEPKHSTKEWNVNASHQMREDIFNVYKFVKHIHTQTKIFKCKQQQIPVKNQ